MSILSLAKVHISHNLYYNNLLCRCSQEQTEQMVVLKKHLRYNVFASLLQIAHDTLLQYGSTDLQALLQITGEGGAWSNAVLTSLLTGQPTNPEEGTDLVNSTMLFLLDMKVLIVRLTLLR